MTTTTPTTTTDDREILAGYWIEPETGAFLTLPWLPEYVDVARRPPSMFPQIQRWARGRRTLTTPELDGPRLLHHLTGKPWAWSLGQKRFLHLWWAVDPDGRWMYRSGCKRGSKGTGKDPMCASMGATSAAGPVVFDGFDRHGRPIGRPHRMALVQIGANSEAQGMDVLRVLNGMISADFASEVGADTGVLRTLLGESRIELLTNSEASAEGDPATDIFLNETHHMTHSSGGQRLAGVARRNAGKSPQGLARVCEFTNGHEQGGGSAAEDTFTAWQAQVAGQTRRRDILYDSREADPKLRLDIEEELELGIAQAYADAPWSDQERIRDEAQDPRVPAADTIRYYFNGLPTNERAWVEPRNFDARAERRAIASGDPVAIFLDCSKSTDSTALRVSRISDGYNFGDTSWIWRKPHGDIGQGWLAPREEVDAVVRSLFTDYAVQWFGVDPSPAEDDEAEALYWGPTIDAWDRDYRDDVLIWATPTGRAKSAVRFDMRLSVPGGKERNENFVHRAMAVAAAIDLTEEADDKEPFVHDGEPICRLHVHNARRRPNQWGISLGKSTRDSSDLVDGAVAMVGADLGRHIVVQSGKRLRKQRKKSAGSLVVLR